MRIDRMFSSRIRNARSESGQILVIVAGAFVVIVAMVGLVVDGGFAWGQQRDTQNAADAASEAGAVVLAEIVAGETRTDTDVANAVAASVAANVVDNPAAYYTDISGNLLTPSGAVTTDTAQAATVGGGPIPPSAAGVRAVTSKNFETFLARVIGFTDLTAVADATAVAGYLTGVCDAGEGCDVLPITLPVSLIKCDQGEPVTADEDGDGIPDQWPYYNVPLTIPLCNTGSSGNVGWLDWTPTAGGNSELIDSVENPDNPPIDVPSWNYMTSTGVNNAPGLEDAINYYAVNQIPILLPMFDSICDMDPPIPNPNPDPGNEPCPAGHSPGNGQNNYYHVPRFVGFLFKYPQGAFISGSNTTECADGIIGTGGGQTGCLKGQFIRFITSGTVGPGSGFEDENSAVGVQLIR
jgi:Flp pilus assembly protein TadG